MNPEQFIKRCQELGLDVLPLPQTNSAWQRFILTNYFFGHQQPDTEIAYADYQWEIKTFKGHFSKIHSPEELITHLYYEYYLPKLDSDPDFLIPSEWADKFKQAGILESSPDSGEFKTARRATLLKRLEEHFGLETGLKDLTFWQNLSKEFPECIYTGPAFRAVLAHSSQIDQNKLLMPGYSWAMSLEGIKNFIKLGDSYELESDNGFMLYTGMIQGISLIHILKFLGTKEYKKLVGIAPSFESEEEIIALDVLSIDEGKFYHLKDIGLTS